MSTILPVDFIDVSQMAAALVMKHAVNFSPDPLGSARGDTEIMVLRGPDPLGLENSRVIWQADLPQFDTALLEKWPSARNVLSAITISHRLRSGREAVFGKVFLTALKVGGYVDWNIAEGAYAAAYDRYHLNLVPSPGAWLYSGGTGTVLPQGQLTYFDNHVLNSAINLGPCHQVNLVVDIRKPEAVN